MKVISSLSEIADEFDIAVLDQWGVLHNGREPYPRAIGALERLNKSGKPAIVLSNSGKRAAVNIRRICGMGFPEQFIRHVETSGETAWRAFKERRFPAPQSGRRKLYPISERRLDAEEWAAGNMEVELAPSVEDADALLLMGLPRDSEAENVDLVFQKAIELELPLICTNPDKTSPRSSGNVRSPGAAADEYSGLGGRVFVYGKPFPEVFEAVRLLEPNIGRHRFLMVGDSLEHDVSGASSAGFSTAFVRMGIHRPVFANCGSEGEIRSVVSKLAKRLGAPMPDYTLPELA